jgi:hypothetical protein
MNQWKIFGMDIIEDSFFASISTAFNGELILNNKKSNNKYSVNGYYSINSIKKAMQNSMQQKGEDINTLENIFKINIIVIEKVKYEDLFVGLPVNFKENNQYENKYGIIEKINLDSTCNIISNNGTKQYENISISQINAIEPFYRVKSINNNYEHSIFVILDNGIYELLYTESKFVFSFNEIPDYIKYFIYITTIRYSNKKKTEFEKKVLEYLKQTGLQETEFQQISLKNGGFQKNQYRSFNSKNNSSSKESKLSYYVVIDLELYPGNEGIPLSQKALLKCDKQYEKIRHSYAELFGLNYRPKEFITLGYKPYEENEKKNEKKSSKITKRYYRPNYYNKSRNRRNNYTR